MLFVAFVYFHLQKQMYPPLRNTTFALLTIIPAFPEQEANGIQLASTSSGLRQSLIIDSEDSAESGGFLHHVRSAWNLFVPNKTSINQQEYQ